ncbi:MAG: glycerol-3-phosphate acyltransferase [Candidatus Heimdallarchaeaceae archaeon]
MIEFVPMTWDVLWAAALGYLLGSIPFAFIFVKVFLNGLDIRTVGSKNVGGRNVIRAFKHEGKPNWMAYTVGIIEAILDISKGYFAMWLTQFISFKFSNGDPWVNLVMESWRKRCSFNTRFNDVL